MTQPPSTWLGQVRRIILQGLRGHEAEVYLYGSWASGTQWRGSDIDVGILPHERLPPGTLATVREALEESVVPYPVEVVDLSETDPGFRNKVCQEGIRWTA